MPKNDNDTHRKARVRPSFSGMASRFSGMNPVAQETPEALHALETFAGEIF